MQKFTNPYTHSLIKMSDEDMYTTKCNKQQEIQNPGKVKEFEIDKT